MTAFPAAGDYISAVQQPRQVFGSDALRGAEFALHPVFGIPTPASGSTAVVFKAEVEGKAQALRFFTREDASSRDRYLALNQHFTARGIVDCVAASTWEDDAIRVNGRTWPVLRMEWVEGRTLDKYVDHLVQDDNTAALAGLAGAWRQLVRRLQAAEFAHGDLQHGNVLVDDTGWLRLVDFDGSWIRSFAGGKPPSEQGHPNYQRPARQWDRWMDTFPALVVYLSLTALSRNPKPWAVFNDDDNLLFRGHDFTAPYQTEVWRHLDLLCDRDVTALATRLRQCCDPKWLATGALEPLLDSPWWEKTATAGGTSPVPSPLPPAPPTRVPLPPPPVKTVVPPPAASRLGAPGPWPATSQPTSMPSGGGPASGQWWAGGPGPQPQPLPPTPVERGPGVGVIAAVSLPAGAVVGLITVAVTGGFWLAGVIVALLSAVLFFVVGMVRRG